MARTMLNESMLLYIFWREVVYTTVHILNRGKLKVNYDKTPYQLWKCRLATIKHFKVFGRKFYIKREDEILGKFHDKSDKATFVGYSCNRKVCRYYNKTLHKIVQIANIKVDDTKPKKSKE